MTVKNLKEWEERVRKAMEPQPAQVGQGFSPAIQRMRQGARQRSPMPARTVQQSTRGQLPTAR